MDAHGSNEGASPGQMVAINTCNDNPDQTWDVYSNGMISVWGLCLDTKGGTSSLGTPLLDLERCDGSSSQAWNQVGSTLVNKATSDCLDDPNANTSTGTQLDISPCNGSQAQNWLSPAAEPCDIYASYGTSCAAAYSTTRAMSAAYDGPLYQVTRASDGTTANIGLLSAGGDVDAAKQDSFCAGTTCTITEIYDQSPLGNNLRPGPGGGAASGADKPAEAAALPITIGGHEAYGVDISGGMGYRVDSTLGVATGDEPEGMYMVASGTHVNSGCCFDFGNAEANNDDNGAGHMDAVNFGTNCYFTPCSGSGPWVQADLENGLFQGGNGSNSNNKGNSSDFVTAMLKNDGTTDYALKGGDAQAGSLSTWWEGPLPDPAVNPGYKPMSKEGAIILGIGGDNSNASVGSFFEGVMTDGYPSDAADAAVQQNIVQAGYAGDSNGEEVSQSAGAAVVHQGYTSVYTVDAKNGDLRETYLSAQGAAWQTQDLSAGGPKTPPVKPGTTPVAVVHDGYTSVFTISAADNHVWETYLSNVGNTWANHDMTADFNTPPSTVTPTALYHDGYTSVYTIDASNGHLQETYLTAIGERWQTQDLTSQTSAPSAQPGTAPVSLYHDGYTSVFTVGTSHDIWETYLSNIGNTWAAHDLTQLSNGPQTTSTVTAVLHEGYVSVYAAGDPLRHLWELYLPAIGDAWKSQDLTAGGPKTPPVAPGTSPVALYHTGYTSVYTVDAQSMHVQETYLSNIGNTWATQDFSQYGTPPATETPIALVHPGTTGALDRTSVFTINQFDNDLQDTYLVAIGDQWQTQDLTYETNGPPVMPTASPTASWSVAHEGYTSAFTVNTSSELIESYLPAMGASWQTNNLHTIASTPDVMPGTTPVAVAWAGHLSVFTVGPKGDLWETYLPAIGGQWTSTDITAATGSGQETGVTPTAVLHGGYLSAYTVDDSANASNAGDLREYYLPLGSASWQTQDLTTGGPKTPQVGAATSPVALYHDGYTSVYTNDAGSKDLQETYLASIGGSWTSQDLTQVGHAPTLADYSSPTALYHSGYTSVFEIDGNGHVWETYLPAIGDSWSSQDLTAKYSVPNVPTYLNVEGNAVPIPSYVTALYHSGYASVFTVDSSGDVHESYLAAIGDSWQTHDLTSGATIPGTNSLLEPSPLVHYDTNGGLTWTSLFTINAPSQHLQETYLQKIGDNWITQGLPS